jgi:cobalt-zinc-cadmium efflux system outer membrane protein
VILGALLTLAAAVQHPAASDSLHLADALASARAHRGTVVAARAAIAEAHAGVRDARALPNPTGGYTFSTDTPRQTATVQQPLDWLFRRGPSLGAAHAGVDRAEADATGTDRALELEVRHAYYGALAAAEVRRLVEAQAAVADSLVGIAERRLASGDIPAAERDRLRLERILALQALSRARADEAGARAALAAAVAWPGGAAIPPLSGTLQDGLDTPPPAAPSIDDLPAIRSAVADSSAAAARLRGAEWGRLPLPDLELGRQWDEPGLPQRNLWLFGVSMPIPLFNRGGAQVSAQRAQASAATALLADERLAARRDIATAQSALAESRSRARLAVDSLLPGAAQLRTRAARAYALGETGVLPLLDALRTEREIVSGAVADLQSYQDATAMWLSLAGTSP